MKRRDIFAAAAGAAASRRTALAETYSRATRGLPPLKITNVKVILTNPPYANGTFSFMGRLVIARVETSEPGLYGLARISHRGAVGRSGRRLGGTAVTVRTKIGIAPLQRV